MTWRDVACAAVLLSPYSLVIVYATTGVDLVKKMTRGRWGLA